MRIRIHIAAAVAAAVLAVSGCAVPPPSAYVSGHAVGGQRSGLDLGKNSAGEACTQQEVGQAAADVYCGSYQQPSAQVRGGGRADASQLAQLATSSEWRAALDQRYACDVPRPTTILGDVPAVLLSCARKIGGWPQVGLVALVGGTVWYADGVLPALPPMERSLGVMSDKLPPSAARQQPGSDADRLMAQRLAAQAFSTGDIHAYDDLMAAGARANRDEDFPTSEKDFAAALAVQRKALGANAPATARPLAWLALQVSDQGRSSEATTMLARAQGLADKAGDADLSALLLYVRGLHEENQGHHEAALALLRRSEAGYATQLPSDVLNARPRPIQAQILATQNRGSAAGIADLLPDRDLLTDVTTRSALLGVIEARRHEAIVLRDMGRFAEADAVLSSAETLDSGNDLRSPALNARLARTAAEDAAVRDQASSASSAFGLARTDFAIAVPMSRPVAETELLRAGQLARLHQDAAALQACDQGVGLLRTLKIGTSGELLAPCLEVMDAAAERAASQPAEQQRLLARMFEAAQLTQGSITTQQIALATARLAEGARDPRVAEAIHRRDQAEATLGALEAERDADEQARRSGETTAAAPSDLGQRIAKAQADYDDAAQALQVAAPNFGQLVQEVASAQDVLSALRPGEAFAAIDLGPDEGWTFVLADGQISAARVPGGTPAMAALVKRLRASIEGETDSGLPPPYDIAAAQEIYNAAFGGVASRLNGAKALVVAPTGPLLSIPFGLLLTGPADQKALGQAPWLLRRVSIAHVPAAANFVSLRRIAGQSRGTEPWFGFGDFRPVTLAQAERSFPGTSCKDSAQLFAGLPPLGSKELSTARALMGASPSDEMLGKAFTAPAVLKANLKSFRILHFSTHGLLPTDLHCEDEPAIVTSAPPGAPDASGALLTASEVQGMDLDADAVILSACNSGGPGGSGAGQSLSGLARAFFFAGARALLVTHWSVNADASAFLVADTLRLVRKGTQGGFAGALRGAELALLDSAGRDVPAEIAHPFYWAPFALIGEGGTAASARAEAQPSAQDPAQAGL